jgi:hypothetical protein
MELIKGSPMYATVDVKPEGLEEEVWGENMFFKFMPAMKGEQGVEDDMDEKVRTRIPKIR